MAYKVLRLPITHAVADRHVTLPLSVLLALPERSRDTSTEGEFNLPSAIDRLLGTSGWERATAVLRPTVLAPKWKPKDFLHFVYQTPIRLDEDELLRIYVDNATAVAKSSGQRGFAIRHYSASRPADHDKQPHEWTPVPPPLLSRWTAGVAHFLASGDTSVPAYDDETRLVILQSHVGGVDKLRGFAEEVLYARGPAVLIVAGEARDHLDKYLTDVYADIVHNRPLSDAARLREPYAIEAELWLGEKGDRLLSFDPWVDQLFSRVADLEGKHATFHTALLERKSQYEPYFYRGTIGREVGNLDERSNLTASRIQGLRRTLDFSRESGGVYPLVDLSDDLPAVADSVTGLYPELDSAEARLRSAARRAPRVLNANFGDPNSHQVMARRSGLIPGQRYDLLVDVGPRWSRLRSIVVGSTEFPEKAIQSDEAGFAVNVVVISDDFFPKASSTWIWVPRTAGRSIPYDPSEFSSGKPPRGRPQKHRPGPAAIALVAPKLPDSNDDIPRPAYARLCLYYEANLIQSARIKVSVVRHGSAVKLKDKNEIRVDFALSNTFQDIESRSETRRLSFVGSKQQAHRVNLNITLNDDGGGTHRIIVLGRPESELPAPGWVKYNPQTATPILEEARKQLVNCFFIRNPDGSVDRTRGGLNSGNGKSFDQFRADLKTLCEVGRAVYLMFVTEVVAGGDIPISALEWSRKLRSALVDSSVIQVARTVRAEYAFPWALVYDIPLTDGPRKFCKLVDEWRAQNGIRVNPRMLDRCPYADDADHAQDVYCPFGLWGLKHIVEQPPTQIALRNGHWEGIDVEDEFAKGANIDFAVAVTQDKRLNLQQIASHLKLLTGIARVTLCPPSPADNATSARAAMANPDVVYFLCHGETDPRPPFPRAFIGIGEHDDKAEHRIYTGTVEEWAEATSIPNLSEWSKRRPLVVINGCHTTDLTPNQMLNFVSGFTYARASGIIGTEVSVRLEVASEAAEYLLKALCRGVPAGQAVREMRWQFANKGNLLGLAYSLYALASLHTHT